MAEVEIVGLIAVYFAVGLLYSGDEWYPGTMENLYLDNRPIWPSFLLKTLFWPVYWLGWIGIGLLCIGMVLYIKFMEARHAQV